MDKSEELTDYYRRMTYTERDCDTFRAGGSKDMPEGAFERQTTHGILQDAAQENWR